MTVLVSSLNFCEQDIINSIDSVKGQDIIASRLLGCIASYMQCNPYLAYDDNWPRVKQAITLLETASSAKGFVVERLARILSLIKENSCTAADELPFLFALAGYYADKLDQFERLPPDERDLLLDFLDCQKRWTLNKEPFISSEVQPIDWDIPSLMELWSCLHYYPSRWAISDYLHGLNISLYNLLDVNRDISAYLAKLHIEVEDIRLLKQQIMVALQSHLPFCFAKMEQYLLFSFTSPFIHQLYTKFYLLSTVSTSTSEEDLILCREYLSRLSIKNLEQFEVNLWNELVAKHFIDKASLVEALSSQLQDYIRKRSRENGDEDEVLFGVKVCRDVLAAKNIQWHEEIKSLLPPCLYTLIEDTSISMLANPYETIQALMIDDLSVAQTVAHSVNRVFTRCIVPNSEPSTLYFYRQIEQPHALCPLDQNDDNFIVLTSDKKLSFKEFCLSPYFEKLKCKEDIFASLKELISSREFWQQLLLFVDNLQDPSWYLQCASDPVKSAHFATISYYMGQISEEAFLVIHRVCEAYRDNSISAQFTVLDHANIEFFLEQRNYPPYAYQKSFVRHKDFQGFLSSLSNRSFVERTCIEYRLDHNSVKNVERFISENGGYKEGCRFAEQADDPSVFYTLLPPFLNIDLYNVFVDDNKKRSPRDYVWGFGYSEDPTPFFQGKRPVSIASVYHTLEDLTSFTIHGFAQPEAKSLGLDFHDSTYHIPIEMNLTKQELIFLGFAAEAMYHFSAKLFTVCGDPIQKLRYQDMFSLYVDAVIDREIFVASAEGRLLFHTVNLKQTCKRIYRHPLIKNMKASLPISDRLTVDIKGIPRNFYVDTNRYIARCIEDLSEDRPPVITLTFGLKASK